MKKQIMTPNHPRWNEFISRLRGREGCDFRRSRKNGFVWKCKGLTDKTFATAILKTMRGVDVDRSLRYFELHGGFCDCEIVFNVAERFT